MVTHRECLGIYWDYIHAPYGAFGLPLGELGGLILICFGCYAKFDPNSEQLEQLKQNRILFVLFGVVLGSVVTVRFQNERQNLAVVNRYMSQN